MTTFVDYTFSKKYTVKVPDFIVPELPPGEHFHIARLESVHELLKMGDIYFDIGTELGWLAPLFAQWVGAENMCLFEPSEWAWPNIRATWEANGLSTPKSTYWGFIGAASGTRVEDRGNFTTRGQPAYSWNEELYGKVRDFGYRNGWPVVAYNEDLIRTPAYRQLIECPYHRVTTLDAWVESTGIIPRGIGMNIEGAEAIVLEGGQEVFKKYHPLVWVGMHVNNGSLVNEYHTTQENLVKLMEDCGYKSKFLSISYEHWWLFS